MIDVSAVESRRALRDYYRDQVAERIESRRLDVVGGELDGVPVVTIKELEEGVADIFGAAVPPMSETTAEVATGKRWASVLVHATCPKCRIVSEISVTLGATLSVDADGSELAVKAKSKARPHTCGQLPLELNGEKIDGEQTAFDLEGIIGPTTEATVLEYVDEAPADTVDADNEDQACGAELIFPDPLREDLPGREELEALLQGDPPTCVRVMDHDGDHYALGGAGWHYETVPVPQGIQGNEDAGVDRDNGEQETDDASSDD